MCVGLVHTHTWRDDVWLRVLPRPRYRKAIANPNEDLSVGLKFSSGASRSRVRTAAQSLSRIGFVTYLLTTQDAGPTAGSAEKNAEFAKHEANPTCVCLWRCC